MGVEALALGLALMGFGSAARAPGSDVSVPIHRRVLVRLAPDLTAERASDALTSSGARVLHAFHAVRGLYSVELPVDASLPAVLKTYQRSGDVLYAEPVLTARIASAPDDPRLASQWPLDNTGQNDGKPDADINALEAWDVTTGSPEVVIAVLDTGVDYLHVDLAANMWTNPGEISGNGIDDDDNGYIDDVHGINAVTGAGDPMDDHGHGTSVAGEIAAVGNNGEGVSGVCWSAKVIACKFMATDGVGALDDAVRCLEYLYDLKTRATNPVGIVVVNASWSDSPFYQPLADAIAKLGEVGVLFVASAGNAAADDDRVHGTGYPASYDLPNVISVAATDAQDALWFGSSFGRHSIHLAAPGGTPFASTNVGDTYGPVYGTSAAAPLVSGVIGLLSSAQPASGWVDLKNLVIAGAQPLPSLADATASGRRLRAWDQGGLGALSCQGQVVAARHQPRMDIEYAARGASTVRLSMLHVSCAEPNGEVVIPVTPGTHAVRLRDDGLGTDRVAGDGIYEGTWAVPDVADVREYALAFPGDPVTVRVLDPYPLAEVIPSQPRAIEGTVLAMRDEDVHRVDAPFPLHFGGDAAGRDALYVTSNGTIVFGDDFPWGLSERLPTGRHDAVIAPFWDDLDPALGGTVRWDVLGASPARELVVEWRDVPFFGGTADQGARFQVVLFEDSSDVVFDYSRVEVGDAIHAKAANATVGIQVASDAATVYGFHAPVLTDGTALLWRGTSFPAVGPPHPELRDSGSGCAASSAAWLPGLLLLALGVRPRWRR